MQEKARLRAWAQRRRDALPPSQRARHSAAIARRLAAFAPYQQAGTVAVFLSFRSEVDTGAIVRAAWEQGKRVAAPVTRWQQRVLQFRLVAAPGDLHPGRLGIPEPQHGCATVALKQLDLLLVPGVAFDREGYRLGYGAGLYDRVLAAAPGVKVGLAFACQVQGRLPRGEKDVPVDWLISELEIISCQQVRERG